MAWEDPQEGRLMPLKHTGITNWNMFDILISHSVNTGEYFWTFAQNCTAVLLNNMYDCDIFHILFNYLVNYQFSGFASRV